MLQAPTAAIAPLLQAQLVEDVHQQVIGQLLEALRPRRPRLVFAGCLQWSQP